MTTLAIDAHRVAVLYAHRRTHYFDLPVVVYTEREDARAFNLNGPVIAHPPCRPWCRMSHLSTAPASETELAFHALAVVRRNCGVLEHPAHSKFWKSAPLPPPGAKDEYGFTLAVSQKWWGHRAEKPTWLYIVGCSPRDIPELPLTLARATHVCGRAELGSKLKSMEPDERDLTPLDFCYWLEELASRCARGSKLNGN